MIKYNKTNLKKKTVKSLGLIEPEGAVGPVQATIACYRTTDILRRY